MLNEVKRTKKYLGYLETTGAHKVYQICDVTITANEIILNTLTPIAP